MVEDREIERERDGGGGGRVKSDTGRGSFLACLAAKLSSKNVCFVVSSLLFTLHFSSFRFLFLFCFCFGYFAAAAVSPSTSFMVCDKTPHLRSMSMR